MDLSSLSSKLLPGFTTLGFREERRSRGKTSPPPTPPSGCPVRPSSGADHTLGVPGGAGAGAQRAGLASASASVGPPPRAQLPSTRWWSSDTI